MVAKAGELISMSSCIFYISFVFVLHALHIGGDYVSMKGLEGTSSHCSSLPGHKTFEDEKKGLEIKHKCGFVAMANAGLW